jgi:hypothetical protein
MSTLVLSLLLLLLVGIGFLMNAKRIQETFENPPTTETIHVSPTLANMLAATPNIGASASSKSLPQVDILNREQEVVAAAAARDKNEDHRCPVCPAAPSCPTCPKCEQCEDMSKYIKMDEIPCWNCTLP